MGDAHTKHVFNTALQYLVRTSEDSVAQTSVVIHDGTPIAAAT